MEYKNYFNTNDFDQLIWHDVNIHSISFIPEEYKICFDIDYIYQWIKEENKYHFLVSPAKLIFKNVYNIILDIESNGDIVIDDIRKGNEKIPNNKDYIGEEIEWDWIIECFQGIFSFTSVGFELLIEQTPILTNRQRIKR